MTAVDEASEVTEVRARPVLMARVGYLSAALMLAVFAVTALVMPRANAGAHFGVKDQVATAVIGVLLAAGCLLLTRPRLHADREAVRLRSFLGGWRTVPWELVSAVEFPRTARCARLVLPAEETLAIYAVQRLDKDQAVTVMRHLRQLLAATRS